MGKAYIVVLIAVILCIAVKTIYLISDKSEADKVEYFIDHSEIKR